MNVLGYRTSTSVLSEESLVVGGLKLKAPSYFLSLLYIFSTHERRFGTDKPLK